MVAAAALAVLTAGLVVSPKPGLGSRIVDLFSGDPAPAEIQRLFRQSDIGAPPGMAPGVIAEDTNKLLEATTPTGHRVILWIAPSRASGWCTYLQREGEPLSGGPGCWGPDVDARPVTWGLSGGSEHGDQTPILLGHTRADVSDLRVELDTGVRSDLNLEKGFFLYVIPRDRQPVSLIATTDDGRVTVPIDVGFGVLPRGQDPAE